MTKKTNSATVRAILNTVLSHSLFHMNELEKQVSALKLKMDGTDKPEDLQKARVFTLVLTILNDCIHSAHSYCEKIFDSRIMEHYIHNQKVAFDNKLVNPCSCIDCKGRGYGSKLDEVAVEGTDNKSQRTDNTATSEHQA